MNDHRWLEDVLQDIKEYAELNELIWLLPAISDAMGAAQKEIPLFQSSQKVRERGKIRLVS